MVDRLKFDEYSLAKLNYKQKTKRRKSQGLTGNRDLAVGES